MIKISIEIEEICENCNVLMNEEKFKFLEKNLYFRELKCPECDNTKKYLIINIELIEEINIELIEEYLESIGVYE